MTEPIFSRPIDLVLIKADGTVRRIAASEAERQALAKTYDLLALDSLEAEAKLSLGPAHSIVVEGQVTGVLSQACIVTLEPVEQTIEETFTRRFVRPDAPGAPAPPAPGAEIHIDPEEDDPPEVLEGSTIDLGAIVREHFVLAIDPYPRAPGAALPPLSDDTAKTPEESPFAALAALQRRDSDGE
jgi:uncharacterized metal-binding protein YceD (DUF177 family)